MFTRFPYNEMPPPTANAAATSRAYSLMVRELADRLADIHRRQVNPEERAFLRSVLGMSPEATRGWTLHEAYPTATHDPPRSSGTRDITATVFSHPSLGRRIPEQDT